jgi:uncharacterized membrane protein
MRGGPQITAPDGTPTSTSWFRGAAWVSSLGDGLLVSALPLLAKNLNPDPRLVTGVFVANRLPWLLSPWIGAVVDRLGQPRRVMMTADIVRAVVLVSTFIAVLSGAGLVALFPSAFVLGAGEIAFVSATSTLARHAVSDEHLDTLNSQLSIAQTFGEQFVGPLSGGAVFAISRTLPLIGDAFSFLLSALLLTRVPAPVVPSSGRSVRELVRDGIAAIRSNRVLKGTALWFALIAGVHTMQVASLVFIGDFLDLSPFGFGVFLACIAAGNVAGAWLQPRIIKRLRPFEIIALGTFIAGMAHLGASMTNEPWVLIALLSLDGVVTVVITITGTSLRQRHAPQDLIGSVMATIRMVVYGTGALGGLAAGFLIRTNGGARGQGVPVMLRTVGVVVLAVALVGTRSLRRALSSDYA